nr:immunoglobulin heavy chain junction region [Mus musculus]
YCARGWPFYAMDY